jgi:hypothetical protein
MVVLPGNLYCVSYTYAVIDARGKSKIKAVAGEREFPIWEGCEVSRFLRQECRKGV